MAGRRITMRVGPLTKGLTDFPEHTGPDWCTQALNVEFVNGGVTTRRGMQRIVSDFYASAATVKLVKAFPLVERNSPVAPMGGEIVVVGIVPTAGGDAKSERVLIRHLSNGSLDGRMRDTELIAPTDDTNPSPRSRWDACVMREPHRSQMTVIVCTDHVSQKTTTVFRSNEFLFTMNPLVPINRVAQPFHGGREVAIGEEDDAGAYTVLPPRARYCRVIAERLVLGGFDQFDGLREVTGDSIWFSNLGDSRGWPLDNVVRPASGDVGPVTGLAEHRGEILVFRANSISRFRIESGLHATGYLRQVVTGRGCVAHSTIIDNVNGSTLFLAQDGFYAFNGTGLEYLSKPIERRLKLALGSGRAGGAWAVHYPLRRQVWLFVPDTNGHADHGFIWDYHYNAWSEYEFQRGAWSDGTTRKEICGAAVSPSGRGIWGVTTDAGGRLDYDRFDRMHAADVNDAGNSIGFRSVWESNAINYGKNAISRWRYLRPIVRPTGSHNLTAWWRRDGQAYDAFSLNNQSNNFAADAEGGAALDAFVLDTDELAGDVDLSARIDINKNGIGRDGHVGIRTSATAYERLDVRGFEIDLIDRTLRR